MNGRTGRYYHISSWPLLRPLLSSVVVAVAIHWLLQCLLEMDRTERLFKISFDLVLTAVFALLLHLWLPVVAALILGWAAAHTLNLVFNGQLMVVLKHFGRIQHSAAEFEQYLKGLRTRLAAEPSLRWAAAYGSLSRGELQATSDLDVRVIRFPGFHNGLRACLFVMQERSRALFERFPLDILLLDSPRLLSRLRPEEPPFMLYQAEPENVPASSS